MFKLCSHRVRSAIVTLKSVYSASVLQHEHTEIMQSSLIVDAVRRCIFLPLIRYFVFWLYLSQSLYTLDANSSNC